MSGRRHDAQRRQTGMLNLPFLACSAVSGIVFLILTLIVAGHRAPFQLDRTIAVGVQAWNLPWTTGFNNLMTWFEGATEVALGTLPLAATFIFARRRFPYTVATALYALIYFGVNELIRRSRPQGLRYTVHHIGAFSYPSGHEAYFVWLTVLAVVTLKSAVPRRAFPWICAAGAVVVLAVAWSRVYTGAHWPSDVLGGLLLGIAWQSLILAFRPLTQPLGIGGEQEGHTLMVDGQLSRKVTVQV